MLGIKIEKENKALKWGKVNLQRSCSRHRLTLVICDQKKTKKRNQLKKFLLKRKCQKVLPEQKITSLIILFFFPQKNKWFLGGRSPSEPESRGRWWHRWHLLEGQGHQARTVGLPQESSGERGSEECSHQNLPSAPQVLHVLNSRPKGSWSFGNPLLIMDWLLLQRGGLCVWGGTGTQRTLLHFPKLHPKCITKRTFQHLFFVSSFLSAN